MAHGNTWNWQQSDWPQFRFESAELSALEDQFLLRSGLLTGTVRHIGEDDRQQLIIDFLGDEAFNTSEIEGEFLNRDSLQSSIRRNFGLTTDNRKIPAAEQGIAQMMVEMYRQFKTPLTHDLLFHWHEMLMNGRRDLATVGNYRIGEHPMQVVSGPLHKPRIHFEAPPSNTVPQEMEHFIKWFADTSPAGKTPLPILTRAGIAHLYFVCIHPFEDGNGRIGRAVAEKAIAEGLGQPAMIALSQTINRARKSYYDTLESNNKGIEITEWLVYFAKTVLHAQAHAQSMVDFTMAKAKFYDRLRGQFNDRQAKAIARMFREGPEGFKGGLTAEKYMAITGAARATATRDLHDLTQIKALARTGSFKGTRYHLYIT